MSVNKKSQVPRSDWKWQIGAVRPKRGGGGLGNSQRAARCWLPPTTTVRWCFGGDGGRLRRSGRGGTLGWLAERRPKNGSRVSAAGSWAAAAAAAVAPVGWLPRGLAGSGSAWPRYLPRYLASWQEVGIDRLGPTCACLGNGVGRQALRYVAVASCRLPPLLARIRNSAQSQPTACTARPGPTPSHKGSNKVQSLTRLPQTRPSTSTVPTTGDCASALVPDEAPRQPSGPSLPSGLTSSPVVAAGEFTSSSSHSSLSRSTKTCTRPRAAFPLTQPSFSLLPPSLLSLPSFVSSRGTTALLECVCAALAGSTLGHRATNLRPYRLLVWALAIRSTFCTIRVHHRSRLRDL